MAAKTGWNDETRLQRARQREDARIGRPWPFNHLSDAVAGRLSIGRLGELAVVAFDGPILIDTSRGDAGSARRQPQRLGTLLLLHALEGSATFRCGEEEPESLISSEVLVASSDHDLKLRAGRTSRLACLVLPVHLVTPRFFPRDRVARPPQPLSGPVSRLIADMIRTLVGPDTAQTSPGGVADAVGGLLSAALEVRGRAGEPTPAPDQGLARLTEVESFLRRHFADPDLTAADVAGAVGMSRRYLHKLYSDCGRSFRQDLVGLRIEACLRAFADSQQADKTIAEIAFAAGYTDISQFNRHFRKLQDATPTAVRRTLLKGAGETQRLRRGGG